MGHSFRHVSKQAAFSKTKSRYTHGGVYRNQRAGRKFRPLSTRLSVHLVFKVDRSKIKRGFRSPLGFQICQRTIKKYAKRFFVKIEQLAICNDHIHILIRLSRRSFGLYFFRVVAGQIAQNFQKQELWVTDTPKRRERKSGIWKHRPFTRVVLGFKAWVIARNYVKLNALEAENKVPYRKTRLRGLKPEEWSLIWS